MLVFLRDGGAHFCRIVAPLFKVPLFHELADDGRYTYTLWCSLQHGITGVSGCIVSVEQVGRVGRHSSVLSRIRVSTSFATWGFQGALDACNTLQYPSVTLKRFSCTIWNEIQLMGTAVARFRFDYRGLIAVSVRTCGDSTWHLGALGER